MSKANNDQDSHSRLGDAVKITLLVWAMGILTANYLGIFKQAVDPTYPASILSGTAASFGLAVGTKKKKDEEQEKPAPPAPPASGQGKR